MKKNIYITLTFILTGAACSNINTISNDYYQSKKKLRHGVIPITKVEKEVSSIFLKPSQQSILRGAKLYKKNCFNCHGKEGRGNGPIGHEQAIKPANLRKLVNDLPNFELYFLISELKGEMPGWKKVMSEEEKRDIRNYLLTFNKNRRM